MKSLPCIALILCSSVALAEPPSSAVNELVTKQILAPLRKSESSRSLFSRAAPVAVQRRVRVLDEVALTDVRGKQFYRFAVDERRPFDEPNAWQKDSFTGCAYPAERQVFVQQDEGYFPARSVLGSEVSAHPSACRPAPQAPAQVASNAAPASAAAIP
ncbi:MAG: hypothetical protein QM778_28895 [Myxococcales bacterium]